MTLMTLAMMAVNQVVGGSALLTISDNIQIPRHNRTIITFPKSLKECQVVSFISHFRRRGGPDCIQYGTGRSRQSLRDFSNKYTLILPSELPPEN